MNHFQLSLRELPFSTLPRNKMSYLRIDLDILLTAYNVQAMIKKTCPLPADSTKEHVIQYIEKYVKNKTHFDIMVVEAQGKRNLDRAQGVHWFQREFIPEHYDIFAWREIGDD